MPKVPPYTANRAELAAILGRSLPTVDAWVRQGCPVLQRGGRGRQWQFVLAEVMAWRVRRAVDDAVAKYEGGGDTVTREEADRRRAVALATTAEIETEETLRRYVTVDDARDIVVREYAAVRRALKGIGSKVAGRAASMSNAPAIQELVDEAIIDALEGLAHGES